MNFTYTPSAYITGVSPSSGLIASRYAGDDQRNGHSALRRRGRFWQHRIDAAPGRDRAGGPGHKPVSPSRVLPGHHGRHQDLYQLRLDAHLAGGPIHVCCASLGVSSLSQTSGPVGGRDHGEITGTNLANATEVDFGSVAGSIVSGTNTATQITAISPPSLGSNPGMVNVTVQTPYGSTPSVPADDFLYYVPGPTVTGLSLPTGPVGVQTTLTISGSGLSNPTAVYFGTIAATIVSSTYNQIVVESPAISTPGAVDVTVVTAAGTSPTVPADQFTYGGVPTISGLYTSTGGNGSIGPANLTEVNWEIDIFVQIWPAPRRSISASIRSRERI